MKLQDIIGKALGQGFSAAALLPTDRLTVVPEYRKYCEENLCGCYDRLAVCPPASGSVEEMRARFTKYNTALILQTTVCPEDGELFTEPQKAKALHNRMAEELLPLIEGPYLWMSAGPYKDNSCMSAYCVDCQKMADAAGMLCWAHDGRYRFFSVICCDITC